MNVITPVASSTNPSSTNPSSTNPSSTEAMLPETMLPETRLPKTMSPDRKHFTVEEYHRLIDLGFLGEDDRIELIAGDLIPMASKGTAHILCCRKLLQQLPAQVSNQGIVQCQDPIIMLTASEPEPDFAVLQPLIGDDKPNASDVLLVIEVSDSSLDYDRRIKGPLYAEALIPHYWIFNVIDRQLEYFSQPQQNPQGKNAGQWAYGVQQIILPTQVVNLPAPLPGMIDLTLVF
jgi:Uma2 family endonuclease